MGLEKVVAPLAKRARRHHLAGDSRAGSYSRGIARRGQYEYLRRAWRQFALFLALVFGVLLLATQFIASAFARGLLLGGVLVWAVMMVWTQVVYVTGTSPAMMGDLGEQWTAHELRKLTGRGWRLVNHVLLRNGDIDHVVVGPGGVFAVETKWTATPWKWEPIDERIRNAAKQAGANAHDLALWYGVRGQGIDQTHPIVFLWGRGAQEIPVDAEVDGVPIVTQRSAALWRESLGTSGITPAQVRGAWAALDEQCRMRDPREAQDAPVPRSPGEWAAALAMASAAGFAGVLATVSIAALRAPWPTWPVWWGVLVALGLAAARREPVRLAGIGWLTGVLAALGFVAIIALDAYL